MTNVAAKAVAEGRAHPWYTAGIVVLIAAAGGGSYWAFGGSAATAAGAAVTSRTVTASTGTIRQSISTTGSLTPADQDELNFGASGEVTSVRVAVGDTVQKGQVLATIDSASLQAALAQAQAQLASAQARVAADDDSSSTTDTQLSADTAAVSAAQGQVTSAQQALASAKLTAPHAGIVSALDLSVGQQVSGSSGSGSSRPGSGSDQSSSASSSTAEIEVIGTSSWLVDVTVDATELDQVKKGLQAQITLDGARTPIFGTVTSVGVLPNSSSSSSTAAYPVTVRVTGSPTGLHSGASATVAIIYKQLSNVLVVPSLAVHQSSGASTVTVVKNGKQSTRTVTTGLSSGGEVQIKSGLSAGEQVLVQIALPSQSSTLGSRLGNGIGRQFPGGFGGGNLGGGNFGGGGGGAQIVIPAGGFGNSGGK